ncbi:flavin-containing monooxygenase [Solibacillus sp. FSL K6-1523]|uniref:flavin-containing monooxygenase n=1 Tax=Solibacillus sp. FSL K6-1523 TaxID=2921471 RepID=UPI0030F65977
MQMNKQLDAVVVGAGFAGLYMLHKLRESNLSTVVYEAGAEVGGVWYWNLYPGAKCDIDSIHYCYTFSEELYKKWNWTSKYPLQHEILNYLNYVTDELDLKKDIQFNTQVVGATFDEQQNVWVVQLKNGEVVTAKYFISAVGCLSATNLPKIEGIEQFQGEAYHTGKWPKNSVDFTNKRVGVIGTGSSGVQLIPEVAKVAAELTVFQRTAQYVLPANNYDYTQQFIEESKNNYEATRKLLHFSSSGSAITIRNKSAFEDTAEEREAAFEEAWTTGGFNMTTVYNDLMVNEQANAFVSDFIRNKIKAIIRDTDTAESLLPQYMYGVKRLTLGTNYYETYNRSNVRLVNLRKTPIEKITAQGIQTTTEEIPLDVIIYATGYDGMTGPLLRMDIKGRNGVSLNEKWEDGGKVRTFLGIATNDFPNFFMITGPESPSVLVVMPTAIEQHVDWISDCINYLEKHDIDAIEPSKEAEDAWSEHTREVAEMTLYTKGDSWYTGSNIEGKPRSFLIYLGGFDHYRAKCDAVASLHYADFQLYSSVSEN